MPYELHRQEVKERKSHRHVGFADATPKVEAAEPAEDGTEMFLGRPRGVVKQ